VGSQRTDAHTCCPRDVVTPCPPVHGPGNEPQCQPR
jgi:hypothetical protein